MTALSNNTVPMSTDNPPGVFPIPRCTVWSGTTVPLENPTKEMIDFEDIARSLSKTCRFNGHSMEFYSVADHSIRVAELVMDSLKPIALLHDAQEAYIGDMVTPLKVVLRDRCEGFAELWEELADGWDAAIFEAAGIDPDLAFHYTTKEIIKRADVQVLANEKKFFIQGDEAWPNLPEPHDTFAAPLDPYMSYVKFCREMQKYNIDVGINIDDENY